MTQDEVKAIFAEVDKVLAERKGNAPTDRTQPLLEGDVVTFSLPKSNKVSELVVYHPEATNANGTKVNEYFTIKANDGREISQTQLVGRRGNGLNIAGETPGERLKNFLANIVENKNVALKVGKLRILPSTNPAWNSQRIVTWEEA